MVEKRAVPIRDETPVALSELDLQTLKSEQVTTYLGEGSDYELSTPPAWRGYVLWGCAAVMSIVAGVVPALWINKWRHGDAPHAQAQQANVEMTVEPIMQPPALAPAPAPATTHEQATPRLPGEPVATRAPSIEANKRGRMKPERGKRQRPSKRPREKCDVYLHTHGCPR